jgi:hypothetical protein
VTGEQSQSATRLGSTQMAKMNEEIVKLNDYIQQVCWTLQFIVGPGERPILA